MQQPLCLSLLVCLVASVSAPGALIDFTSRSQFATATALAVGLPDSNGVDFTSAAVCPTVGCAAAGNNQQFASNTGLPATASFSSISGFSVQGFAGLTGSSIVKLYLTSSTWQSPSGPTTLKYGVPVMNTRDLHQSSNSVSMRVNFGTAVTNFAVDLSNGCKINNSTGSVSGCDPGDNQLGSVRITTSAGDIKVVDIADPSQSVGEFRFYGAQSDTPITFIDIALPTIDEAGAPITNIGSIVLTRIAFGALQTPEPATWLLAGLGLAALLASRRRIRIV